MTLPAVARTEPVRDVRARFAPTTRDGYVLCAGRVLFGPGPPALRGRAALGRAAASFVRGACRGRSARRAPRRTSYDTSHETQLPFRAEGLSRCACASLPVTAACSACGVRRLYRSSDRYFATLDSSVRDGKREAARQRDERIKPVRALRTGVCVCACACVPALRTGCVCVCVCLACTFLWLCALGVCLAWTAPSTCTQAAHVHTCTHTPQAHSHHAHTLAHTTYRRPLSHARMQASSVLGYGRAELRSFGVLDNFLPPPSAAPPRARPAR